MAFTLVSYNVLAQAYVLPERYSRCTAEALDAARRLELLASRVRGLDADVVCLQEVEAGVFRALDRALAPSGYQGHHLMKRRGKPEGVATFSRTRKVRCLSTRSVAFQDGSPPSGHVALVTLVQVEGRSAGIVNTHIKWDAPGTQIPERTGYRQLAQLLQVAGEMRSQAAGWIFCGDFNILPADEALVMLREHGMADAFGNGDKPATAVIDGKAKRIDYIFHSRALAAAPGPIDSPADGTAFPSAREPSDHLPIGAAFSWTAEV